MAAEVSYLHKLYNRGVDIGVGLTTSLFVALVGLAFWKLKLLMELHSDKKRRELQFGMEEQRARQKREVESRERHARLTMERDEMAERTKHVSTSQQLADIVDRYFKWLELNDIHHRAVNLKTLTEHPAYAESLRSTNSRNIRADGEYVEKLIRATELPRLEGDPTLPL